MPQPPERDRVGQLRPNEEDASPVQLPSYPQQARASSPEAVLGTEGCDGGDPASQVPRNAAEVTDKITTPSELLLSEELAPAKSERSEERFLDVNAGANYGRAESEPEPFCFGALARWTSSRHCREEGDEPKDEFIEDLFVVATAGEIISSCLAYESCLLRLATQGIEIRKGQQDQWFLPWEAIAEVENVASIEGVQPPPSHLHVLRISASFCLGLINCSSCTFQLAARSQEQVATIAAAVKKQQWLQKMVKACKEELPPAPSPPPATISSAASRDGNAGQFSGTCTDDPGPAKVPVLSAPPKMLPSPPATPPEGHFAAFLSTVSKETVPAAAVGSSIPRSLVAAMHEDEPKMPDAIHIEDAWFHMPPGCPDFHRVSICVDKLGLSLQPFGLRAQRFRTLSTEVDHESGLVSLPTESISFPATAVLDAEEDDAFQPASQSHSRTHVVRGGLSPEPRAQHQQTQLKQELQQQQQQSHHPQQQQEQQKQQQPQTATSQAQQAPRPGMPRKHHTPLSRVVFSKGCSARRHVLGPCEQVEEGEPSHPTPEFSAERPPPEASHFVAIKVRAAVAGRQPGQERAPPHMRLQVEPRPALKMVLALHEKEQSLKLISTVLAFKQYQLSVALQSFLQTFKAMAARSKQRGGYRLGEEGDKASSSGGPPPLRPPGLPPPSRLPRIVANEEGEVFWYLPRKDSPSSLSRPNAGVPFGPSPTAGATAQGSRVAAAEEACPPVAMESRTPASPVPSPGRADPGASRGAINSDRCFTISV
eukprot:TRINITY_DN26711_c0_g1_i2.p1 TRINITY_DN26711_c0_g1~~TRINITY_DN26711_c0_g1_i2.p1  ORF type:complete len:766 (+),score=156.42 TRINITY_DN26711_c0_g1_i2:38-2335(+)